MHERETIRAKLAAGKRLASGGTGEIAALVLEQPRKASQLIECLWDEDPGVANRAADALDWVSQERPSVLASWKDLLLGLLTEATEIKLRWKLAIMVPRLKLTPQESRRTADLLQSWLEDKSSIVKTWALQGLADLTRQDKTLLPEVLDLLRIYGRTGTPAMQARIRHMLPQLESGREPDFIVHASRPKAHLG